MYDISEPFGSGCYVVTDGSFDDRCGWSSMHCQKVGPSPLSSQWGRWADAMFGIQTISQSKLDTTWLMGLVVRCFGASTIAAGLTLEFGKKWDLVLGVDIMVQLIFGRESFVSKKTKRVRWLLLHILVRSDCGPLYRFHFSNQQYELQKWRLLLIFLLFHNIMIMYLCTGAVQLIFGSQSFYW